MKNIFKQQDFDRCRFCGNFCNYSEETYGYFIEKFRCGVCKYHWCIDVNSKIMDREIFFGNAIANSWMSMTTVIVDYR